MRLIHDKADWLPKVLELNRVCFSGVQRAPDAEVRLRFNSPDCSVFILRTSLELLGFAICESREPEVHLWSIAVKEGHRGHNLGGYLLDEVRQYYQELDYEVITLNVHVDNLAAIHLYERLGFRKVSVLKRWFLQDGDGIRMTKELSWVK